MSTAAADGPGSMADLVAFEVEGSGYYLVPLDALLRYEIETTATNESLEPVGWGWSLPVVRWNTFHSSQVGTGIALAPGVVAWLAAHHFIPSSHPSTHPTSLPTSPKSTTP